MTAPIAIAIGINEAFSRVAGRAATLPFDEIVEEDVAPIPQRVLAVSGAATHAPDVSFQTLIYDLFINYLNRSKRRLQFDLRNRAYTLPAKKLAGTLTARLKFFTRHQSNWRLHP
jgi:hypothetical protein